jgi:hypothetical protein
MANKKYPDSLIYYFVSTIATMWRIMKFYLIEGDHYKKDSIQDTNIVAEGSNFHDTSIIYTQ